MEYAYTILYVVSVEKTLNFYEQAFGYVKKFITPEGDYGELLSGQTTIAFASHKLADKNLGGHYQKLTLADKPFSIELAFTTEKIEEDFEKAVAAGATIVSPIQQKPWKQKVGYLRDIDGFLIEICTPIHQ